MMPLTKRAAVSAANVDRIKRHIDGLLARLQERRWQEWQEWRDWQEEKRAAQRGVL